jgi:hypothetical protein
MMVQYCGPECQAKDWPKHKTDCKNPGKVLCYKTWAAISSALFHDADISRLVVGWGQELPPCRLLVLVQLLRSSVPSASVLLRMRTALKAHISEFAPRCGIQFNGSDDDEPLFSAKFHKVCTPSFERVFERWPINKAITAAMVRVDYEKEFYENVQPLICSLAP